MDDGARSVRAGASRRGDDVARAPGDRLAFEAEVLPGLEPFARTEIAALGADIVRVGSGEIGFTTADWDGLLGLRRIVAAYRVLTFDVPRPKALLGDRDFRTLVAGIEEVRAHAPEPFRGFRFGAAGSDSAVFRRLAEAISAATGLAYDDDGGELLVRVRPSARDAGRWEVLPRLTPRPLSARAWRACNMAGGLNASLAACMHDVALDAAAPPRTAVRYLNAMCGSGTLAIEWRLSGGRGTVVACDVSAQALACARENVAAAGEDVRIELVQADATQLDAADGAFDLIVADVPWGDAVGSHARNASLYPAFLAEAARVLSPGGVLVVLTHEVQMFEELLAERGPWHLDRIVKVFHGGHWPRIYRLVRTEDETAAS